MKQQAELIRTLGSIDGKGYKAYKVIKGEYDFFDFMLIIDHVQGDPFAQPSRVRVRIKRNVSGFSSDTTKNRIRTVALCDYLTRSFYNNAGILGKGIRASGKSGMITILKPAQEILERSSMVLSDQYLEARIFMGLPAFGRKIAGAMAVDMFVKELPLIVARSLFMKSLDEKNVYEHIETAEDTDSLRNQLDRNGLVAFVAEGAALPRKSGISPEPAPLCAVLPFKTPDEYRVTFTLPNKGTITGMGIPKGVTLIVGGGYHGKSTLLNAIELGIYNHIPGDGREFAVSDAATLKIRASDGRCIEKTDISPFINNLPFQKDTTSFSTANASGSTSQAAAIIEGIEAGAKVLLLDEDTSATNFLIRDHRMQQLVLKENEPITPFIDKVRLLYDVFGISTILVIGGSGDYFSVADHVIQMRSYSPYDVTSKAHAIAERFDDGRQKEGNDDVGFFHKRIPEKRSVNPYREDRRLKIEADGVRGIRFGEQFIDLGDIEQLVETAQTKAIGYAIFYAIKYMDGENTLKEIAAKTLQDVYSNGLEALTPYLTGDLSMFRSIEFVSAINRMRSLRVSPDNM